MRKVSVTKIENTTIVKTWNLSNVEKKEIYAFNGGANYHCYNDVLIIDDKLNKHPRLIIKHDELEDNLGTVNLSEYIDLLAENHYFVGFNGGGIAPYTIDDFKKIIESGQYNDTTLTGTNAVIQLRPEGSSRYAFSNVGLVSIDGFGLDLITGNPDAEAPYPGKDLFIENTGTTPFSLLHQGSGAATSKFFFLDETDLVVPAGGKVWLKYGATDCEVIFKSWSDIDLSTKADLVGGKVPSSQLPSYVDDVLEFENVGEFPAVGEVGKIYVDLEANSTYRWSGSVYVAFSTTKKTQKIYFSNSGLAYHNSIGGWLQPGGGNRFNQSYNISSPPLDINNNFEGFNYLGGIHEIIDFDSKIKKIELQFAKTSVASVGFDFRIVLLNYKLPLSDFPVINQNLPYDKLIVFNKTYRMANPLYYNVEIDANELLDNTLLKGSYLRMFIGLFNYTNNQASVINFSMTTQLEEV